MKHDTMAQQRISKNVFQFSAGKN